MYRVILIVLTILGFVAGLGLKWLVPGLLVGLPGWIVGVFFGIVVITVLNVARASVLAARVASLERNMGNAQIDRDVVREELAALRDQVEAIPDSGSVVAELKVLQGLMEQFTDKKTSSGDDKRSESSGNSKKTATRAISVVRSADHGKTEPISAHDDAEILGLIQKALREDSIELYLQPTVLLPQRKRVFYECYSRITHDDGSIIRPEQYLPVAEKAGLMTAVDNLLLFRCIQLVRRAHRGHLDVSFFCNISDATLTDVDFFTDFIDFMAENLHLAANLIFELDHATVKNQTYGVQTSIKRLSELGFRFSLDQVANFELDLPVLSAQGFKFVKIDAHLLHETVRGDPPRLNFNALKGALNQEAMDLIVEKIETEEMLLDLLDLGIDFGQGYLFGEPRPSSGSA